MKELVALLLLLIQLSQISGQGQWLQDLRNPLTDPGIPEDTPIGTLIGTLNHVVPGLRTAEYSTTSPYFFVTRYGNVTLARELSYKLNPLTVDFIATIAADSYENTQTVTVKILPVNHAPQFDSNSYVASVKDNTVPQTQLTTSIFVTDPDTGPNGTISVSCLQTSPETTAACQAFQLSAAPSGTNQYQITVTLLTALDYSKTSSYYLLMRASDGGTPPLTDTAYVNITVENEQDTRPIILNTPITISVNESAPTSTDLGAIQARAASGQNSGLLIKIVSDPMGFFRLEDTQPTTGQPNVYQARLHPSSNNISRDLITDQSGIYFLRVAAVNLVNGQQTVVSSETTITVQVIDVNNHAPTFLPTTYTASVTEGMPYRAVVPGLSMVVTDLDAGDNAYFVLDAQSNPAPSDVFGVDPTFGSGSVGVSLVVLRPDQLIYDDPNRRQYVVTVTARENRTVERFSGQATVTINVQNPNNQPTPFYQNVYSFSILDNKDIGNIIGRVSASDSGGIAYAITAGNDAGLFAINPSTGDINVARTLNAATYPEVRLKVSATNQFRLVSSADVIITIRSQSSGGPLFTYEPYVTTADENSVQLVPTITIKATPQARDKVVRYQIIAGNEKGLFNLTQSPNDPLAVQLVMNQGVDYNDTPNRVGYFLLTVQAADDTFQPLFTNASVVINIRDLNNHKPNFLNNGTYFKTITEITPKGSSVLTVNATDLDAGENARVTYYIAFGSRDNFIVDYNTGLISVAPQANLDIDQCPTCDQYNITVYGVDHGSPAQTGTAMVYITVNASIYQSPKFLQTYYEFAVPENADVNTNVGNVTAEVRPRDKAAILQYLIDTATITAKDAAENPVTAFNSSFNFKNYFRMDPASGGVYVAQPLNRNYVASVMFTALANITNPDQTITPATVSVKVYILPKSIPNQPVIQFYRPAMTNNQANVSIFETPTAGGQITQFGAVVYGNGPPVAVTNYQLGTVNDPDRLLALDNTTGVLSVAKPIVYDKLTSKVLTYQVIATDPASKLSATATIIINVRSLADGRPVFQYSSYNFSVYENETQGYKVGQVKATVNGPDQLQYSIVGLNAVNPQFTINQDTGEITVSNPLDAETRNLYTFTVVASDKSGLGQIPSTSAYVTIRVLDVNEFGPQFLGEPYSAVVYETTPRNTTLLQVQAFDPDASNTKVTYQITGGNDQGLFKIDPNTGVITPNKDFTGYSKNTPYVITITATDSGNPPMSTSTTVSILIRNQTAVDQPPTFIIPVDGQSLPVYENRVNERIVQAVAVSGRNSFPNISYGLYDSPAYTEKNRWFNFDPVTGNLTTKVALNRTATPYVLLGLQAFDNGFPALWTVIQVNVTVYSDAPPTFTSCPGNFSYPEVTGYAPELEDPPVEVITVKACSYDINPIVYYYITAGNDNYLGDIHKKPPFRIDKLTGKISTNERLQWYDTPILYINVTASKDSFGPNSALSIPGATITVKVIVTGKDNNGPTFDPNPDKKDFCRGIGTQVTVGILDITGYNFSVIQFYAGDCDSPNNRNNTFYISTSYFNPPDNQAAQSSPTSFYINATSGWVYTRETSYIKYTDGTFQITVVVQDSQGRSASSQLTVYIIRESQRFRYVFTDEPRVAETYHQNFVAGMNGAIDTTYPKDNIQMIEDVLRLHIDSNANVNFNMTDMCFHVFDNDKVLNLPDVKNLINGIPSSTVNSLYTQYHILDKGANQPMPCNVHVTTKWWSGKWFLWWLLIALALFIWVVALILIICVCIYWPVSRRNYFKSRPYVVLDDPPVGGSEFEWQHSIHRVD